MHAATNSKALVQNCPVLHAGLKTLRRFRIMQIEQIELDSGTALGLKLDMEHAPLLVIRAPKGFIMCGYLDIGTSEMLGDVAVRVIGVSSFEDVLNAQVVDATQSAKELGIVIGMSGKDALEHMF